MDSLDILNDKLKAAFPGFSGFYPFADTLELFGLYTVPGRPKITTPIRMDARDLFKDEEKAFTHLRRMKSWAEAVRSPNQAEALKALHSAQ